MKKLLLFFVFAAIGGTLTAQDLIIRQDAETIDGKVIRVGGSKIEYTKAGDHAGPVYTLSTNDVLLIKYGDGREESFKKPAQAPKRLRAFYKDNFPHYQGDISVGYGMGVGNITKVVNTDRIQVETVHGVRISPYAFIGLGAGFNYFYDFDNSDGGMTDYSDNGGVVTAFANAKGYYPVSQGASIYLSLDLGGAFGVMNLMKHNNDMYAAAGPGISFGKAASRQRADLGIRFQYMGKNTSAVLFRIGFEF